MFYARDLETNTANLSRKALEHFKNGFGVWGSGVLKTKKEQTNKT